VFRTRLLMYLKGLLYYCLGKTDKNHEHCQAAMIPIEPESSIPAFLIYFLEIPGSNLGRNIDYPDRFSVVSLSSSIQIPG
jgi:hypothetical protein